MLKLENIMGVPLWLIRLRVWWYHCSGSGCCCSAGSIPGPGVSICHRCGKKKKIIIIIKKNLQLKGGKYKKEPQSQNKEPIFTTNFPHPEYSPRASQAPTWESKELRVGSQDTSSLFPIFYCLQYP